jgi:hypothetical protein
VSSTEPERRVGDRRGGDGGRAAEVGDHGHAPRAEPIDELPGHDGRRDLREAGRDRDDGGCRGVTCTEEYEPWEHDLDGRVAEERQTFGCGVDREDDP